MAPLQYMVMGYQHDYFRDEIVPELTTLSRKHMIRIVDLIFVRRDAEGNVTSQEPGEAMPEVTRLIHGSRETPSQWFTQEDIDAVGEYLPDDTAVVLLLFEHAWASRLDEKVHHANQSLTERGLSPETIASEIEHTLAMGAGASIR